MKKKKRKPLVENKLSHVDRTHRVLVETHCQGRERRRQPLYVNAKVVTSKKKSIETNTKTITFGCKRVSPLKLIMTCSVPKRESRCCP